MPLVKEILGYLPTSVWTINKRETDKWDIVKDTASSEFGTSRHFAFYKKLSMFNPALAARVILYWTKPGDIVLDPFAGRSTRGVVAVALGRNYFGYECVPKVCDLTRGNLEAVAKAWQPDEWSDRPGSWVIYQGDGCQLKLTPNDYADLIFTCPPYHQLEQYEPSPGQLSAIPDYNIFLHCIETAAHRCFDTLKPGGFAIWVVADWRENRVIRPFHKDCMDVFERAGFLLWDEIINVLWTPAVRGVAMAASHYKTIKSHEYILVWRKPGATKKFERVELGDRIGKRELVKEEETE